MDEPLVLAYSVSGMQVGYLSVFEYWPCPRESNSFAFALQAW